MQLVRLNRLGISRPPTWSPTWLGASLLAFWDAERSDLVTRSGGLVTSWKDVVGAYDLTQASGASRPAYSATSFNGRPGATFDATDDKVAMAAVPASFPLGAANAWLWAVVSQDLAGTTAGNRDAFGYGNQTASGLRLGRGSVANVNRARIFVGTGGAAITATNGNIDFSGRHVLVAKVSATAAQVDVGGNAGAPAAGVPAIQNNSGVAIGGAFNGGDFWGGVINACLLTLPLSGTEETLLQAYLNRRL